MVVRPSSSTTSVHKKGLSIERLGAFLAVLEAGGIARAAPGEPVRQSQLSRQVSELERALGVALFDRGAQGPRVPTAAGSQLARLVRELHRGIDDVSAGGARNVTCTLGAGDSSLRWLLLPNVAALRGVELHVGARSSEEVAQELGDGTLELGVVRSTTALPAGVKVARLGVLEYTLFAPTGRRAKRSAAPLAVTTGEPALAAELAPHIAALTVTHGAVALRCETFPQLAAAVRAGYAGILPTIARAEVEPGPARVRAHGPVLARALLVLAWRARLDTVRPQLVPVRTRLVELLRRSLTRG